MWWGNLYKGNSDGQKNGICDWGLGMKFDEEKWE
jgi:hypothetical protein